MRFRCERPLVFLAATPVKRVALLLLVGALTGCEASRPLVGSKPTPPLPRFELAGAGGVADLGALAGTIPDSATRFAIASLRQGLPTFIYPPGTLFGASQAFTINDHGQIVGVSSSASGALRATLWTVTPAGVTVQDLGTLPGETESAALGINNRGQIVGISFDPSLVTKATLWTLTSTGVLTQDLGALPGASLAYAGSINDSGQIVGFSGYFSGGFHPALWTVQSGAVSVRDLSSAPGGEGGIEAIDINNTGQVVGIGGTVSSPLRPMLWTVTPESMRGQDLGLLPGAPTSGQGWARGINNLGQIVGWSMTASGAFSVHAALWTVTSAGVTVRDLGTLPGGSDWSQASAINDVGQIVGLVGVGPFGLGTFHAALWTVASDTVAVRDLGVLPGAIPDYSAASGVSSRGQVVGTSGTPAGVLDAALWSAGLPNQPPLTLVASVTTHTPPTSFTTWPLEDSITLSAALTPQDLAPRVTWVVQPDPPHYFDAPSQPPQGTRVVFAAPQLPTPIRVTRWPANHASSLVLAPKQLSFRFTATVQDDQGQLHQSNTVTATQDEIDTIREEYVEFGLLPIPDRGVWGTTTAPDFKANELNSGDYQVYWVQSALLDGLETVRGLVERTYAARGLSLIGWGGLPLTSTFRNPVHHTFHINPTPLLYASVHERGLASDISTFGQPLSPQAFFDLLRTLAKDPQVQACFEPAKATMTGADGPPNHAHLDWRSTCPQGW